MGRSSTAKKSERRDAASKLAQSRPSVIELAKALGNVAEACRRRGLDRTSFHEWKRRFQTQGFEGLKDLPPPAYGCDRHEAMLALEGVRVSSITIRKILNENDPGTKSERWLALERQNADTAIEITPEQAACL